MYYWIFHLHFKDEEMLNQAVQMAVDYPYPQSAKSFENQVNAVSVFNYISEISKIQSPTLVMFGQEDLLFSELETAVLFKDLSNSKHYYKIPKAAHSIHIDNPEGLQKPLVVFFKGLVLSFMYI